MLQTYNWQLLFFIKFIAQEYNKPETLYPILLERLKKIQNASASKNICVNICIETDLPTTAFFQDLPQEKILPNKPYFVLLGIKGNQHLHTPLPLQEVKWKGVGEGMYLIDVCSKGSLADPDSLLEVIKKFSTYFDTEYTLVTTFDHGSAYGIFYDPPIYNLPVAEEKNMFPERQNGLIVFEPSPGPIVQSNEIQDFGFNKGIGNNDFIRPFETPVTRKVRSLTMDELAIGLSGLKKGKADILVMLNCYMMTIDTQYALKDNVDFLIATQAIIDFKIFEFHDIIHYIIENPNINPENLGHFIISNFRNHKIFESNPKMLESTSIAMVNLNALSGANTWDYLKEINTLWYRQLEEWAFFEFVKKERSHFAIIPLLLEINKTDMHLIDFLSIYNAIGHYPNSKFDIIATFIEKYRLKSGLSNKKNRLIGEKAKSSRFYNIGVGCYFPFGAISYKENPYLQYYYNEYPGNPNLALYARETDWNNFLFRYFGRL